MKIDNKMFTFLVQYHFCHVLNEFMCCVLDLFIEKVSVDDELLNNGWYFGLEMACNCLYDVVFAVYDLGCSPIKFQKVCVHTDKSLQDDHLVRDLAFIHSIAITNSVYPTVIVLGLVQNVALVDVWDALEHFTDLFTQFRSSTADAYRNLKRVVSV